MALFGQRASLRVFSGGVALGIERRVLDHDGMPSVGPRSLRRGSVGRAVKHVGGGVLPVGDEVTTWPVAFICLT
eukprot:1043193-Lingulodinium_polyedra.AAC.1